MTPTIPHTFHIPVMGLAFTIDSPVKVAKYGISSVLTIMEDQLIEQMRESISKEANIEYIKIEEKDIDHRAKRITAYLNLLDNIVKQQIEKIKNENFESNNDIENYFQFLPNNSENKKLFQSLKTLLSTEKEEVIQKLKSQIVAGSIDVNIMTKLDKTNYDKDGNELPPEYTDASAALRGYANSTLESSIIFSAGLNPRLFSYCEKFSDFFPDENGKIKKKIVLKVSDYRSALIQGKYLAKKGLWVSEFRIESGINCGGHAFITDGVLFGPILEDFKNKRETLFNEIFTECNNALTKQNKHTFKEKPYLKISAQGGIGNNIENNFLLNYYNIDSVGWGSPFLLVPEVTNVDKNTLQKLAVAKKDDYYLSNASPIGVPFNNFKPSSSEIQRKYRIDKSKPGSPCYKKYLSSNTEFTEKVICTASRQYQKLKIEELEKTEKNPLILEKKIEQVLEKDCLCEGLGASALIVNNAKLSHGLSAVAICPGPNLAYFSGTFSLKQMIDHIYGRENLLNSVFRPNCFINEIELYIKYFKKEFENLAIGISNRNANYFQSFKKNLAEGVAYYETLCEKVKQAEPIFPASNKQLLESIKETINQLLCPTDIERLQKA